jgi:hypothetical protein
MPTIEIETDQLLHAALQMPRKEFERFVTRLFTLKARQQGPGLSEREADLLMKINQGLPSAMQTRLNALIDRRRTETISAKELRELKKLTDRVETFDVERLELLTQLAVLRNIPLRKLIKQLGIQPAPHD